MTLFLFQAERAKTLETMAQQQQQVDERKISLSTEDLQRSTSMRRKWEQRIEKRRPSSASESDADENDDAFERTDHKAATVSRNASHKALAWEKRFTETKDEVDKQRPPPLRNMTLDAEAENEPGLDSLSKSELAQLANELESEHDEPIEEQEDDALVAVTAHVTQTAIENAIDDLKEQSLLESIGSESFDKSEQIHSTIITSSTSTNESVSIDALVIEQQSEELPTDAQTEEISEANTEDPVFEAELNTPAELKTPDDLKTPDFAKGELWCEFEIKLKPVFLR